MRTSLLLLLALVSCDDDSTTPRLPDIGSSLDADLSDARAQDGSVDADQGVQCVECEPCGCAEGVFIVPEGACAEGGEALPDDLCDCDRACEESTTVVCVDCDECDCPSGVQITPEGMCEVPAELPDNLCDCDLACDALD